MKILQTSAHVHGRLPAKHKNDRSQSFHQMSFSAVYYRGKTEKGAGLCSMWPIFLMKLKRATDVHYALSCFYWHAPGSLLQTNRNQENYKPLQCQLKLFTSVIHQKGLWGSGSPTSQHHEEKLNFISIQFTKKINTGVNG